MDHSDPLRAMFADDIVFHQSARNPTSGNYQGLDAVLGLLRTLGERSGGPSGPRSTPGPPGSPRIRLHDVPEAGALLVTGQLAAGTSACIHLAFEAVVTPPARTPLADHDTYDGAVATTVQEHHRKAVS